MADISVQMFVAAIHASFKHCFEHPTTPSEVEKGSESLCTCRTKKDRKKSKNNDNKTKARQSTCRCECTLYYCVVL